MKRDNDLLTTVLPMVIWLSHLLLLMVLSPETAAKVDATVEPGYTVTVDPGMTIYMDGGGAAGSTFTVESGATVDLRGNAGSAILFSNAGSSPYAFTVKGLILADYVIFESMDANGIEVTTTGSISAAYNFSNCTFRNGTTGGGACLTVDNTQDFRVAGLGAIYNTTWQSGATYNAAKTVNSGYLQFVNYSGALSGESYDNDSYNRILWGIATPSPTFSPTRTATNSPTRTPTLVYSLTPTRTPSPTFS
ncbi:hypothetical protein JW905_19205, partial [bacterium]|nr:hypothetical protein [candidate division CSSED10-310 bacterium]